MAGGEAVTARCGPEATRSGHQPGNSPSAPTATDSTALLCPLSGFPTGAPGGHVPHPPQFLYAGEVPTIRGARRVAVAGARRVVSPGIDHFVPMRAPETLARKLMAFFNHGRPLGAHPGGGTSARSRATSRYGQPRRRRAGGWGQLADGSTPCWRQGAPQGTADEGPSRDSSAGDGYAEAHPGRGLTRLCPQWLQRSHAGPCRARRWGHQGGRLLALCQQGRPLPGPDRGAHR
jgi:hypothetical protein